MEVRVQRRSNQRTIETKDVADIYLINLMYRKVSDKSFLDFRLYEIQQLYLEVFREMMQNQLEYYIRTNRCDNRKFSVKDSEELAESFSKYSISDFPRMFSHTFRSNKKDLNDSWITLAERVATLEKVRERGIINALDAINNSVHNSSTYILGKLPNFPDIFKVLQVKFQGSPRILRSFGSSEIVQIFDEAMA